jgi:Glucodextranase, domain N
VADGVLSDVYSPTIENTDNGTLQYIVTDGTSFADLQQRDMTYTVSSPDPRGMVCQVTSTDAAQSFQLVTDYVTGPGRDSVVMQTRLLPLHGDWASVAGLKVYDRTLRQPPARLSGLSPAATARMRAMYWLSANVLKADEDKTYPGAFVASPTDPWGQSVPATTTHAGWTYREVFARDSYETFTGLLADGDVA